VIPPAGLCTCWVMHCCLSEQLAHYYCTVCGTSRAAVAVLDYEENVLLALAVLCCRAYEMCSHQIDRSPVTVTDMAVASVPELVGMRLW
jgi:hypothetical protein